MSSECPNFPIFHMITRSGTSFIINTDKNYSTPTNANNMTVIFNLQITQLNIFTLTKKLADYIHELDKYLDSLIKEIMDLKHSL